MLHSIPISIRYNPIFGIYSDFTPFFRVFNVLYGMTANRYFRSYKTYILKCSTIIGSSCKEFIFWICSYFKELWIFNNLWNSFIDAINHCFQCSIWAKIITEECYNVFILIKWKFSNPLFNIINNLLRNICTKQEVTVFLNTKENFILTIQGNADKLRVLNVADTICKIFVYKTFIFLFIYLGIKVYLNILHDWLRHTYSPINTTIGLYTCENPSVLICNNSYKLRILNIYTNIVNSPLCYVSSKFVSNQVVAYVLIVNTMYKLDTHAAFSENIRNVCTVCAKGCG